MPSQHWRSPVALQVGMAVYAAICVAVGVVFFPPWFGIPIAVLVGGFYLSAAVLGYRITVDSAAGLLTLRFGLIVRRIRLADVTAVLVDADKVSIGRVKGGEISIKWPGGWLGRLLRVPSVGDIGHAISAASALARHAAAEGASSPGAAPGHEAASAATAAAGRSSVRPASWRTPLRSRSAMASALVACAGAIALAAAFLVRLHWHNPAMGALAVVLALWLGVAGVFYLLISVVVLLSRPASEA